MVSDINTHQTRQLFPVTFLDGLVTNFFDFIIGRWEPNTEISETYTQIGPFEEITNRNERTRFTLLIYERVDGVEVLSFGFFLPRTTNILLHR